MLPKRPKSKDRRQSRWFMSGDDAGRLTRSGPVKPGKPSDRSVLVPFRFTSCFIGKSLPGIPRHFLRVGSVWQGRVRCRLTFGYEFYYDVCVVVLEQSSLKFNAALSVADSSSCLAPESFCLSLSLAAAFAQAFSTAEVPLIPHWTEIRREAGRKHSMQ
eukprot:583346-Rhodomonas_salina.1